MSDGSTPWASPKALRRLIEDSGESIAVIEEAVKALRVHIADLEPGDPDVVAILRAHLLAVGAPSAPCKFFAH